MIGPAPMCASCRRLHRGGGGAARGLTCDAFPSGIPEGILNNEVDHREPVLGDGGLQYSPEPGAEPRPWWPGEGE